jgi:hypothetical protein
MEIQVRLQERVGILVLVAVAVDGTLLALVAETILEEMAAIT